MKVCILLLFTLCALSAQEFDVPLWLTNSAPQTFAPATTTTTTTTSTSTSTSTTTTTTARQRIILPTKPTEQTTKKSTTTTSTTTLRVPTTSHFSDDVTIGDKLHNSNLEESFYIDDNESEGDDESDMQGSGNSGDTVKSHDAWKKMQMFNGNGDVMETKTEKISECEFSTLHKKLVVFLERVDCFFVVHGLEFGLYFFGLFTGLISCYFFFLWGTSYIKKKYTWQKKKPEFNQTKGEKKEGIELEEKVEEEEEEEKGEEKKEETQKEEEIEKKVTFASVHYEESQV